MQATVYITTSVDGFIARKNGDINWLPNGEASEDGEDYGYQTFINSVDAIVMGRNTYETVLSFGSWPYAGKPVVALSSRQVDIPKHLATTVEWMDAPPRDIIRRLTERGYEHLYIDGGKTIQRFLWEGCINRLILTRVPILLGAGISLFGALPHDVRLRHLETQPFANGLVQSQYEVL